MIRSVDPGRLARSLLWGAAFTGAVAWADAFWVGRAADPSLDAWELAVLALGSGGRLLAPILGSLAVIGCAASLLPGRTAPWASPGGRAPVTRLVLPVCAFWTLFLAVLARADYNERWLLKASLWGLAASVLAAGVAGRRRPLRARPAWVAAAAALLLWAPAAGLDWLSGARPGPSGASPGAPPAGRPSFLLIVIDTLRADHLGSYGYARRTSPVMDELAAGGVRFEEAISPSSWTLPSMGSIFTSIYPARHGADREKARLPRELADIASELRRAGYRTGGFATNPWLNRIFGFDDGFEEYYDNARLTLRRNTAGIRLKNMLLRRMDRITRDPEEFPRAREVTDWGERWLRGGDGRPFFLYLHYMDVHHPYLPYPPYRGLFCPGHEFDLPEHALERRFRMKEIGPERGVLEHMIERYDEGIRSVDDALGTLVADVKALGLGASTTILLTSDHGEGFYDHGGTGHRRTVYQEVVRVPLLVTGPGAGSGVIASRVSTLDIFPTIMEWAGAQAPPALAGASFASRLRAPRSSAEAAPTEGGSADPSPAERAIGSQLFYKSRAWTALFMGPAKLIRILPASSSPEAQLLELYHLDRDPAELQNEAAAEPERARSLLATMEALHPTWGRPGEVPLDESEPLDEATLEKLRGLGYIK